MKYNIIYADPPWKYNARNNANTKFGAGTPYPTMKTKDIMALDVEGIAADNCALLMWCTGPYIAQGVHAEVMRAWGFRPVTIGFTWVKTLKDKPTEYRLGTGNYSGSNSELCMLGIRGRMPQQDRGVRQVIAEPITKHSRKPPCTRDRIVRLFGDLPRIELFARDSVEGWHSWGNELQCDADLTQK